MASLDEKAVSPPQQPQQLHLKTPRVTEKASHDTFGSDAYTPTAEKTSVDGRRTSDVSSPVSNHLNPFDTDVEAIISPAVTTSENCGRRSTQMLRGKSECQVWPGQNHWKRKHKAAKMKRSCRCLSHLSKRNRLIVKILIGFLIVGIAVGVGFGISKPLGASIWQPHDGQS